MKIAGYTVVNRTKLSDRDILSFYEIGKAFYESGIKTNWSLRQESRAVQNRLLFIVALLEAGAQIKGQRVASPLQPYLYDGFENNAYFFHGNWGEIWVVQR